MEDKIKIEEEVISIDKEIHKLYEDYAKEEDTDVRRDMRKYWKQLVKRYEHLTGYNPYRSGL